MLFGRPRSLLWRVGLLLVIAQLLLVLIFGWLLETRITRIFNDQRLNELQSLAPWVSGALEPAGVDANRLQELLQRADLWADGLRVTIVGQDGRVLADSDEQPGGMENQREQAEIEQALRLGSGHSTRYSPVLQREMTYYAVRSGPVGNRRIVRVALPETILQRRLAQLADTLVIVLGIYLLLTIGVIYLVWRWLSQRVRELASGAMRYAGGDLSHRVPVHQGHEFEQLSEALNQMARQLSGQMGQLRMQGSEMTSILQSMSNGVIALDLDSRVLSMNRVALHMFGLMGRDVRGRLLQEFVRDPALNSFVQLAIREGEHRFEEVELAALDDRRMQLTSEPLLDAEDRIIGVVMVFNEVTLLRQLETIRTDFAANVSHELRTPIMAIQGYAELLQEDPEETHRAAYVDVVIRNTRRLSSIIEDLLMLSRLEEPGSGESLEQECVRFAGLVAGVLRDCEVDARQRRITIETDVEAELEWVVNRPLIVQALSNLVLNAVRYSHEGASVRVIARSIEDELELVVRDDGPGITPENQMRLFERFYRVDRGRSRDMGGTGLGLSIVKHIARVHGGTVQVQSTPGEGSAFTIRVPRRERRVAGEGEIET
ncbi:MAG: ATP-binding protein [Planctomycetota bacterium]|nr:ATP-binding protein [Planctomycetota bacterium]